MLDLLSIVQFGVDSGISSDYVALAYLHDDAPIDACPHAAFVVQYKGNVFEFHYDYRIFYQKIKDKYFYKITDTIISEEVPAFIAYCLNIKANAKPEFGYFYSGESYDIEGNHKNETDAGERMTCVGFCLNVLKGFLEEDYISYADWGNESHNEPGYLEGYCEKYGLDISKVKSSHRRITPIEYLTSGLFYKLPISKSNIDGRKGDVEEYIKRRVEM